MNKAQRKFRRTIVIICIAVPVGLLHFVIGRNYSGPFPHFVNGYLIDILLPFACYFIMCNIESSPLNRWWVKGLLVFGFGCTVEISQYYGVPIFGETFDLWDFAAYGTGVLAAIIVEMKLFPSIFGFWRFGNSGN
ncbi:hypothetical protein ACFLQW_03950 [Candidatus Zixiibacteriota bacterium]